MRFKIIPTENFLKDVKSLSKKYKMIKDDIDKLSDFIQDNPKDAIHMGKGIYKIRLKSTDMKKGKRGGFRVIYYLLMKGKKIYLLTIYSKGELEDIDMNLIEGILKELNLL